MKVIDQALLSLVSGGADIDVDLLARTACTTMANQAASACNANTLCSFYADLNILSTNVYNSCVKDVKAAAAQQTHSVSDLSSGAGFDWAGPDAGDSKVDETASTESAPC
ncbi:MAG: hypothetical protein V4582_04110 [Pseudomonadota bacterium]